jgi:Flp pilus assembly protein TadG
VGLRIADCGLRISSAVSGTRCLYAIRHSKIRIPHSALRNQKGGVSVYLALLLTFILFSLLVMAIDVGRLYMVQGELQTAVDAAALAAATRLTGGSCATLYADVQIAASFDSTGATASGMPNDNRFNMRLNQVSTNSEIPTTLMSDYFALLNDAQVNANGGQSGPNARYVRVQVNVEMPVTFTRFLSLTRPPTQPVAVAGMAGVSSAVCTACFIEPLAVVAIDTTDEINYGFQVGQYYTFYLSQAQRATGPQCRAPRPGLLTGTETGGYAQYLILNHYPWGPETGVDGQIFRLGAAPMVKSPDTENPDPGCVTIDAAEVSNANFPSTTCAAATQMGRDFLCGLNARFGVDSTSNACANVEGAADLAPLLKADTDPGIEGTLQDYGVEYCGNQRRLLTVAVIDDPALLTVLNFRQFLLQNSDGLLGLNVAGSTAAPVYTAPFRAEYIGYGAPLASGGIGGACMTLHPLLVGPGRPVLHGVINNVQ